MNMSVCVVVVLNDGSDINIGFSDNLVGRRGMPLGPSILDAVIRINGDGRLGGLS